MSKVQISLACCDYCRTRAIFDGRIEVDGCEGAATPFEPRKRSIAFKD